MDNIPINLGHVFNSNLPATGTGLLGGAIAPTRAPSVLRIYICLSVTGVLSVSRTRGGATVTEVLNSGAALVAGAAYMFLVSWLEGDSLDLTYSVPSVAATTCANATGTCNGSPVSLGIGSTVITVTAAGTFTITLAAGLTGTATSGTATLVGSPVALVAGANVVDTGVTTGTFTIALTGGLINKLQIDELWKD